MKLLPHWSMVFWEIKIRGFGLWSLIFGFIINHVFHSCEVKAILLMLVILTLILGLWSMPGNLVRSRGFRNPGSHLRKVDISPASDQIPGLEHMTTTLHIESVITDHVS